MKGRIVQISESEFITQYKIFLFWYTIRTENDNEFIFYDIPHAEAELNAYIKQYSFKHKIVKVIK